MGKGPFGGLFGKIGSLLANFTPPGQLIKAIPGVTAAATAQNAQTGAIAARDTGEAIASLPDTILGISAKKKAAEQMDQQIAQQQDMINTANEQIQQGKDKEIALNKEQQERNASELSLQNRNAQKSRQRKLASAGQSFRDTVLTGPIGLPSSASGAKKTLLGV
jgi:hypothetical protein